MPSPDSSVPPIVASPRTSHAPFISRPAFADEAPRVRYLLPGTPETSVARPWWFLGLRAQPLERIVLALWFRPLREGASVECDLMATPTATAAEKRAFFANWEAYTRSTFPQARHLQLAGWQAEDACQGEALSAYAEWTKLTERPRWRLPSTAFLPATASASASSSARRLTNDDQPMLERLLRDPTHLQRYEWMDAWPDVFRGRRALFEAAFSFVAGTPESPRAILLARAESRLLRIVAWEAIDPASALAVAEAFGQGVATSHPGADVIVEGKLPFDLSTRLEAHPLPSVHRLGRTFMEGPSR